jgi:sulfite exporter TauE/SafE
MNLPLVFAGLALGLAASPHCALMCAAPCAAMTGGAGRSAAGFHAGRMAGYMAGGALAASSMALLASWSQAAPALRPLWTVMHLAFIGLGLWWLATGRSPARLRRDATVPVRVVVTRRRALRATAAGLAWVAWPCAALQAALLLAALSDSAWAGALVMGAFATASLPGLALAPWMWQRWQRRRGAGASVLDASAVGFRVAGAGLVLASGWALTHGVWERFAGWCLH